MPPSPYAPTTAKSPTRRSAVNSAAPAPAHAGLPAAWMLAVVLLVVAADTLTLAMPPQRYLRRKVLGISFVALVGILVNAVALVITAVWSG